MYIEDSGEDTVLAMFLEYSKAPHYNTVFELYLNVYGYGVATNQIDIAVSICLRTKCMFVSFISESLSFYTFPERNAY